MVNTSKENKHKWRIRQKYFAPYTSMNKNFSNFLTNRYPESSFLKGGKVEKNQLTLLFL
jgi:hypothetical protein